MKMLTEFKLRCLLAEAWEAGYQSRHTYNDVVVDTPLEVEKMRESDIKDLLKKADEQ